MTPRPRDQAGRLLPMPLRERFDAKWQLDPATKCWLWLGCTDGKGRYGQLHSHGKTQIATHIAWELYVGPIPSGMSVLHTCDTPLCVRPPLFPGDPEGHLWLGTQAQNLADMRSKQRSAIGERHGLAKLTNATVLEIRERHARGERVGDIARAFSVCHQTVSLITRRVHWRHV